MEKIAVLTSGGDAPGMNAHIRAIVRTAIARGVEVYGVMGGYQGLIEGKFVSLDRKKTVNILDKGGTILKTSRSEEFKTYEGKAKAVKNLRDMGIGGLITCGGDGTLRGAHSLHAEFSFPVIGTPCTIDNDLYGTYFTIGYDTATNTAADAIYRIRDTADSHGRVFVIEVMGRHAGHIAMDVGIACGAEYISVPEAIENLDIVYKKMQDLGMHSRIIIIIGEGGEFGGANLMAQRLTETYAIDVKTAVLGHIQRGGKPSVKDRVLASHLGMAAVNALLDGYTDVMIGRTNQVILYTPLEETWQKKKVIENYYFEMAEVIA